jgi:hypothetical protein
MICNSSAGLREGMKHDKLALRVLKGVTSRGRITYSRRHSQGFKRGNLTTFLADVFTPNSHPIGQTLGMAGLPGCGVYSSGQIPTGHVLVVLVWPKTDGSTSPSLLPEAYFGNPSPSPDELCPRDLHRL